jgi:hypothetical protein
MLLCTVNPQPFSAYCMLLPGPVRVMFSFAHPHNLDKLGRGGLSLFLNVRSN